MFISLASASLARSNSINESNVLLFASLDSNNQDSATIDSTILNALSIVKSFYPSLKPKKMIDFSGNISYYYNYFEPNPSENNTYYQISPNHFLSGEINTSFLKIPITTKLTFDPQRPKGDQLKINFAFDQEKFNSNLEEKYDNEKNKFHSYKDSLLKTNLTSSLNKQLAEIKLKQLKDSINTSQINDQLLTDTSIVDTSLSIFDSLNWVLDSTIIDTVKLIEGNQKYANYLSRIMALEKQIEAYNQNISKVIVLFENDSLLEKNSIKYDLRHKLNLDSLDGKKYLEKGEKLMSSVKKLQIGTVSPQFSKLSTYRATITGLDVSFQLSKNINFQSFAGWQSNIPYNQIENAIKSVGLKGSMDALSSIEVSFSVIHNYRGKQFFGESYLPEIQNSILGFSVKSFAIKNIVLGAEIDLANNVESLNRIGTSLGEDVKNKIAFSVFTKIKSPKTKSTILLDFSVRPSDFQNYLTPYQLPASSEFNGSYSQQLFKARLNSRISFLYREINPLQNQLTTNNFSALNIDFRTKWARYPNVFSILSYNNNNYANGSSINHQMNSIFSTSGVSYMHRIKKTKLFSELSYQYRVSSNNISISTFNKMLLVFRLKNETIQWNINGSYSISSFDAFQLNSQFLYAFNKTISAGITNRINGINSNSKYSNGIKASFTFKKLNFKFEYLINNYSYSTSFTQTFNTQLSLRF